VLALQSGGKNAIIHSLVQARAAATKVKSAAEKGRNAEYQKIASKTISAINELQAKIRDISDPIAIQEASDEVRIAAEALKVLVLAVRSNDGIRASEKSKTASRALVDAAKFLHITPAQTAAEAVQEEIIEDN